MKPNFLHIKSKYYPIGRARTPRPDDPQGSSQQNTGAEQLTNHFKDVFGDNADEMFKRVSKSIKDLYTTFDGYSTGLNKTAGLQEQYNSALLNTAKSVSVFEENEKSNIKTLQIGTKEIIKRRIAYIDIQTALGATNAEMTAFMETMQKSAPLYGKLMAEMAKSKDPTDPTKMSKAAQFIQSQAAAMKVLGQNTTLSGEQMDALNGYSAASGNTLGQQVAIWEAIATEAGNGMDKSAAFQMITEGIAEAGADVRSQYGKLPGAMESAILKSKKLGLSLKDLNATGESLLDIESSVSNELEYQQLSGKRLVDETGASLLNMYREATLSGNPEAQADVMTKILASQEDILNSNNMYAKKSLAANLNMTVEQLMAMREQKKIQDQINDVASKYGNPELDKLLTGLDQMDSSKFGEIKMKLQKDFDLETGDFDKISKRMDDITKSRQDQLSPVDKIQKFLESSQQTGLLVKIRDFKGQKAVTDAAGKVVKDATGKVKMEDVSGEDAFFDAQNRDLGRIRTEAESPENYFNQFIKKIQDSPEIMKLYGANQLSNDMMKNAGDMAKKFAETVPVLNKLADVVEGLVKKVSSNIVPSTAKDFSGGLLTPIKQDAVIGINDGVVGVNNGGTPNNPSLSFNANDKLTIVAGPYGSINDKTADKLVGGQPSLPELDITTVPTDNSESGYLTESMQFMKLFTDSMSESIDQNTEALYNLTQTINDITSGFELTGDEMQEAIDMGAQDVNGTEELEIDPSILSDISDATDGGITTNEFAQQLNEETSDIQNLGNSSLTGSIPDDMQYNEPDASAELEQMERQLQEAMGLTEEQYAEFNDAFYADWQEGMGILAQENPEASQQELEDAMLNAFMETIQEEMSAAGMTPDDMSSDESALSESDLEYPESDLGNNSVELGDIMADDLNVVNTGASYNSNQDIINAIEYGFNEYSKNVTALDSKIIEQAIYEGMKQVTITINLDPMAIHKEIEFRKDK